VAWSLIGNWGTGSFLPVYAEAAAFVEHPEICAQLRKLLTPLAGREAMGGHVSVSYEGPIDRLLALLDAALGDKVAAEQQLRGALALAERRGFATLVAQLRYDLGNLAASVGQKPDARAHWQTGLEVAAACELRGYVARFTRRLSGDTAA